MDAWNVSYDCDARSSAIFVVSSSDLQLSGRGVDSILLPQPRHLQETREVVFNIAPFFMSTCSFREETLSCCRIAVRHEVVSCRLQHCPWAGLRIWLYVMLTATPQTMGKWTHALYVQPRRYGADQKFLPWRRNTSTKIQTGRKDIIQAKI